MLDHFGGGNSLYRLAARRHELRLVILAVTALGRAGGVQMSVYHKKRGVSASGKLFRNRPQLFTELRPGVAEADTA